MLRHAGNTTALPTAQETRMLDSLNHFLTLENSLLDQHQMGLAPSTQGLTCNSRKKPAENDVTQACVELHENSCDALQIDSATNFMFSNPIYFVAFLTEVINQTLLATKTNKEIDIYQIISDSAGKQMGIPIDVEQLKSLT